MAVERSYIVKSGAGYVADRRTLEMISGPDDTAAVIAADRMSEEQAESVCARMSDAEFDATPVELILMRPRWS